MILHLPSPTKNWFWKFNCLQNDRQQWYCDSRTVLKSGERSLCLWFNADNIAGRGWRSLQERTSVNCIHLRQRVVGSVKCYHKLGTSGALRSSLHAINTIQRMLTKVFIPLKQNSMPSVLWHCWLGGRKGIRPVKNWVVGCGLGYESGSRCRFAYGPDDAMVTHYLLLQ